MSTPADRFRAAREAASLSYTGASEASGVGRTTLYSIERGQVPRLDVATKLAVLYGVSLDWLACLSDEGGV